MLPNVVRQLIGDFPRGRFLQKVVLVEVLLPVDVELVSIPVDVVPQGVVAVFLYGLLHKLFYGGAQDYKVQILVKLIRLDVYGNFARGLVLHVQYVTAEILRGGDYSPRRGKQGVNGGYSENVHYEEKGYSAQNVQKQENRAENGFHGVVHFTAEKAEQRDYRRGDYQRPVAPVQQKRWEKRKHIGKADYAGYERAAGVKEKQSRQN